jgi:PAS domain S-box-containing protein
MTRSSTVRFGAPLRLAQGPLPFAGATLGYGLIAAVCIAVSRVDYAVAQIWLANAVAVLVLGSVRPRHRPSIYAGVFCGGFAANWALAAGPALAAWLAAANLLETALAFRLVDRVRGGVTRHGVQRTVAAWMLGAIGAPAVAALAAAAGIAWAGAGSFFVTLRAWLIADSFAMAMALPWLLRGSRTRWRLAWPPRVALEFALLTLLSLAASVASLLVLESPFLGAALVPIFTAARLPLGPQIALAAVNALAVVVLINVGLPRPVDEVDRAHLTLYAMAAYLPGVFTALLFDSLREQMAALDDNEARWRTLLRSSPIGKAVLTVGGDVVEANPALANLLGYDAAELVGRSMRELVSAESLAPLQEALSALAAGREEVVRLECGCRRRDGTTVATATALVALRGASGEATRVIAQVIDVSERVATERRLARAIDRQRDDERFRAAVEVAPTSMVIVDRSGRISMVNAQVERAFGYRREELIGRSIEVLIPARLRDQHRALRRAYLQAPQTRRMGEGRDLHALRKDGSEFPVEVGLAAFETSEGPFVLAALIDITQRKQGEAAILRANADLEEFAYIVSHDLRTPLRAIDNLVAWIEEDLGDHRPRDVARNLHRLRLRVRRMENMIRDVFEYSRIGRTRAAVETVDLQRLIRTVLDDLDAPSFSFEVAVGTIVLETARTPLETVLRNLLGNAVKHHDRGAGRIDVEAHVEGAYCAITVTDDGPGIAPQDHARIFKLFQTLAPASGESIGGIGLAVVKKWVEAVGGRIDVVSPVRDGRGASFILRWPMNWEQAKWIRREQRTS